MISRARLGIFVFALASLVVCGGLFFYFQFRGLIREKAWEQHALDVGAQVENARHGLFLFEAAARATLSTSASKENTQESLTQFEGSLRQLRRVVSDSPQQELQLDDIELRLGHIAEVLQEEPKGVAADPAQVNSQIAQVENQLSAIRMDIWGVSQFEQQGLAQKESQRYLNVWIAKLAALTALLLNIAVVLALTVGLRRDFRRSVKMWKADTSLASMEEQLQRAQKMESVGLLAGGIAHDYNNLLMVIGSYTKLLGRRISPSDPLLAEYVSTIQGAVEKATSVTKQLLTFSRQQAVGLETLDLNVVVSNFCRLLPGFVGESIEMRVLQGASPCRYRGDRGQMEQVIMNLVANARDAMPEGGKLTIEVDQIEVKSDIDRRSAQGATAGQYVRLAIRDTGVGMDERTKGRIFEPFFTTKERDKGTGLGLATVDNIVQQNGGFIVVDSAPRRGTTVKVHIPALATTSNVEAVGKLV